MYIAFDCETTGLTVESNLLTAYFIIYDDNLNEQGSFGLGLRHKVYHVTAKALEVNGIDLVKHDKDAMDLIDARRELMLFLNTYYKKEQFVCIGHNVNFDVRFLKNSGLLTYFEFDKYFNPIAIDTIVLAQYLKSCKLLQDTQSLRLEMLCKHYNITKELIQCDGSYHSAEYDTRCTVELLKKLREHQHTHTHTRSGPKKRKLDT
jgi:DNA polymerase III alpha subunit (gram-positive type)